MSDEQSSPFLVKAVIVLLAVITLIAAYFASDYYGITQFQHQRIPVEGEDGVSDKVLGGRWVSASGRSSLLFSIGEKRVQYLINDESLLNAWGMNQPAHGIGRWNRNTNGSISCDLELDNIDLELIPKASDGDLLLQTFHVVKERPTITSFHQVHP